MNGIICINKPAGMTSQRVVSIVRRICGEKKAGHGGTLDPEAEGVLPVLLGRATRISGYLLEGDKRYLARIRLGVRTDTQDLTGEVLSSSPVTVTEEQVKAAVLSMEGTQLQTPPMYSALKVGGRKLYELAREGREVEREAREITISSIKFLGPGEAPDEYVMEVACSKGTYIRTLCADVGEKLGCGAAMSALRRLEAAGLTLDRSVTPDRLEELAGEGRIMEAVIPAEDYFAQLPSLSVDNFYSRLLVNGCEVLAKKLGTSLPADSLLRLYRKEGAFVGLAQIIEKEEGPLVKLRVKLEDSDESI